jgi:hypothetical protein
MNQFQEGHLLRIFINESFRLRGKPLYEAIVKEARALHLAGATVTKGIMGYGLDSKIHTAKILRLSEDLPIVIEIVDEPEKIEKILPFLEEHVTEGLVTLEKVQVVRYQHQGGR